MNLKTIYALGITAGLALTTGCGSFGDGAKQVYDGTSTELTDELNEARMPLSRILHNILEDFLAGDTVDEWGRSTSQENYVGMGLEEDKWEHRADSEQYMGAKKMRDVVVDGVTVVGDEYDMNGPFAPAGFGSGYRD